MNSFHLYALQYEIAPQEVHFVFIFTLIFIFTMSNEENIKDIAAEETVLLSIFLSI